MTSSAREALLAEALGDLAALLDRLEAVKPALETIRGEVLLAGEEMTTKAAEAEARIAAVAESAASFAVKRVARRVDEFSRLAADREQLAMRAAMRQLLQAELGPHLLRLTQYLEQRATRTKGRAAIWWACAASAVSAASITAVAAAWLVWR